MITSIKKPVCFIKVHTTGLNPHNDRLVSIAIEKRYPDGAIKKGVRLIDPERDIPVDATAIHGITNDMVKGHKTFEQVGKNLYDFLDDADIIGFNVRFDVEFLMNEFERVGLSYTVHNRNIVDLYDLYIKLNPRTFSAAVKQYIGYEPASSLSAENYVSLLGLLSERMLYEVAGKTSGAEAPIMKTVDTIEVVKSQGLQTRMLDIRGWLVLDGNNRPVFNMGQHKGKSVADVLLNNPDYYEWMRSPKANVPKDALNMAERILKKAKNAITEGA